MTALGVEQGPRFDYATAARRLYPLNRKAMSRFLPALPSLVASLRGDPFYQAMTIDVGADEAARDDLLARYFDYSLHEANRHGRCQLAEEDPALGAAAWLLPREEATEAAEAAAKKEFLEQLLGPRGWSNYERILEYMSHRSLGLVSSEAWYLSIVGVSPAAQGRGLGARLLAPTLAEADALGVPAWLETYTPRNVRFYERLGFSPTAAFDEPTAAARYLLMSRPARLRS